MRLRHLPRAAALLAAGALAGALATGNGARPAAAQTRPVPPPLQPYTPTRDEWLAVECEASLHHPIGESPGEAYELHVARQRPGRLLVVVRYAPNVDRRVVNIATRAAKQVIYINARAHGWDAWLDVAEDIAPGDTTGAT